VGVTGNFQLSCPTGEIRQYPLTHSKGLFLD